MGDRPDRPIFCGNFEYDAGTLHTQRQRPCWVHTRQTPMAGLLPRHHLDVDSLTCALSVMMVSSCRGEGNYQAVRKVRLHPCATCKVQHARSVLL